MDTRCSPRARVTRAGGGISCPGSPSGRSSVVVILGKAWPPENITIAVGRNCGDRGWIIRGGSLTGQPARPGNTEIDVPSQAVSLPGDRDESYRSGQNGNRIFRAGQTGGKRRFRQPRRQRLCELQTSYGPLVDCRKTQPDPVIVDAAARHRHPIEGGGQCGAGPAPRPCPPAQATIGIPNDERTSWMYALQEVLTHFTQGPDSPLREFHRWSCAQQHCAYRP